VVYLYILLQNLTLLFSLLNCLCTQVRRCVNGSYVTDGDIYFIDQNMWKVNVNNWRVVI